MNIIYIIIPHIFQDKINGLSTFSGTLILKEVQNLDVNIQSWNLSTNFFEWGLRCTELSTDSTQVPGVSPILAVSFAWNTVQPEINSTRNTTKRTYGVGQCKFEMLGLNNRYKVQDAFKAQTLLPTMEIIRFINFAGQASETERYIFKDVFIVSYSMVTDDKGCKDLIAINSTGEHKYIQTVRGEDGRAIGQLVSSALPGM